MRQLQGQAAGSHQASYRNGFTEQDPAAQGPFVPRGATGFTVVYCAAEGEFEEKGFVELPAPGKPAVNLAGIPAAVEGKTQMRPRCEYRLQKFRRLPEDLDIEVEAAFDALAGRNIMVEDAQSRFAPGQDFCRLRCRKGWPRRQ